MPAVQVNKGLSAEQLEGYKREGFVILRQVFSPERIAKLTAAIERLLDRALAGEVEIRWIDSEQRLPNRTGHLLNPDKYDPAYAEWIDKDLAEIVESIIHGPARHSLFGMLASGGGNFPAFSNL